MKRLEPIRFMKSLISIKTIESNRIMTIRFKLIEDEWLKGSYQRMRVGIDIVVRLVKA